MLVMSTLQLLLDIFRSFTLILIVFVVHAPDRPAQRGDELMRRNWLKVKMELPVCLPHGVLGLPSSNACTQCPYRDSVIHAAHTPVCLIRAGA
jgi:hypothetical protein